MSVEASHPELTPKLPLEEIQGTESTQDAATEMSSKQLDPESLSSPSAAETGEPNKNHKLHGSRLVVVTVSFMLSILLVALDQNIICKVVR